MNARLLFGCFLLAALQLVGAEEPRAGEEVDLAAFGQARTWDGNPGVEWDWHTLLNADGDSKVQVQVVESEVIWRAK